MTRTGAATILTVVGVCVLGVGLLLHIVGLSTPEWDCYHAPSFKVAYGLWNVCEPPGCFTYPEGVNLPPEIKVCEAFSIIGMVMGVCGLGFALIDLGLIVNNRPVNRIITIMSAVFSFLAVGAVLITVTVWGVAMHLGRLKNTMDLGYSFILIVIGGVLMAFGGVVMFLMFQTQTFI